MAGRRQEFESQQKMALNEAIQIIDDFRRQRRQGKAPIETPSVKRAIERVEFQAQEEAKLREPIGGGAADVVDAPTESQ